MEYLKAKNKIFIIFFVWNRIGRRQIFWPNSIGFIIIERRYNNEKRKNPQNEHKATTKRWIADDCCRRLWFYVAVSSLFRPQKAAFPAKTMCSFSAHHQNIGCFVWFVYWSLRLCISFTTVRRIFSMPKNPVLWYSVCWSVCAAAAADAMPFCKHMSICIWCTPYSIEWIWHTHIQNTDCNRLPRDENQETRKQQHA